MSSQPARAVTSKAAHTREKLLDAGVALFALQGYEATGTRQVERDAAVQRNLINYHFGTKQAFWKACVERVYQRSAATMRPAITQSRDIEPGERIRFLIRQFVRTSAAHPQIAQILFDEGRRDEWRLTWIVDNFGRDFYAAVQQVYEDGCERGIVPDLSLAQFYYTLVGSAAMFAMAPECRLLSGVDPLSSDCIDAQADAIARLLTRPPSNCPPAN